MQYLESTFMGHNKSVAVKPNAITILCFTSPMLDQFSALRLNYCAMNQGERSASGDGVTLVQSCSNGAVSYF